MNDDGANATSLMGRFASRALYALALAAYGASAASADPLAAGAYRVVLQSPGGDLPFELDLAREGTAWAGYLVNGKERLKLDDVTVKGSHLDVKMPGYENRLSADADPGSRQLRGEVVLDKLGGKDQHLPLRAQWLARPYRFFRVPSGPHPSADVDLSGRWSVTFAQDDGKTEAAVGEFTQAKDVVSGTFLTATGDHRYLAGQVRGDRLYLSTFDGAHAFLYEAKIATEGVPRSGAATRRPSSLAGDFWSGTAYHERWTAQRDANAALPDAYSLTAMRTGSQGFEFAFPDLGGNLVTSKDPKFQHKVTIIALAGSWCPNCHDEAAFLAPLYRDYRAKGLEIVALMFEHFGDFERAAAATQRFRQHYGIEYTTLIAGISDKDEAAKKLPMLDRVYAFPTTVFIDRRGRVRKIHTGYSGPATGEHYTQFVAEFKRTLDQLLAET
ncbi:MAG: TlpA family protein disulfide reductase [Pseudomonadota bacterium]|nr:TlpA family protein disulfide reductase [Pseudomonadota bacterium]